MHLKPRGLRIKKLLIPRSFFEEFNLLLLCSKDDLIGIKAFDPAILPFAQGFRESPEASREGGRLRHSV